MSTPTILLVEDDESIPILMKHLLTKYFSGSLELKVARTLADGLALAPQAVLTILDLTLPPSGPATTMEAIPDFVKHCPVVVFTGYEDSNPPYSSSVLVEALEKGADSCVFKSMVFQPPGGQSEIWFMWVIQSALHRWSYNKQIANAAKPV